MTVTTPSRLWVLALILGVAGLAAAQSERPSEPVIPNDVEVEMPIGVVPPHQEMVLPRNAWRKLNQLSDAIFESTLRQNDWNTEQDVFMIELNEKLKRINSFDVNGRINAVLESASERYSLREDQKGQIRTLMIREGVQFLVKNTSQLRKIMEEIKSDELWDKQITPELVAKYTSLYRPLMESGHEAMERANQIVSNVLDDQQRIKHQADWDTGRERFRQTSEMVARWQAGQWSPKEWGLTDDGRIPDNNRASRALRRRLADAQRDREEADEQQQPVRVVRSMQPAPTKQPAPTQAGGSVQAPQLSAWMQFVERYIVHYEMDQAQQGSARSIGAEMSAQGEIEHTRIEARRGELNEQLNQPDLDSETRARLQAEMNELNRPLDRMFGVLVRRLDTLLTTEQAKKPALAEASARSSNRPGGSSASAQPAVSSPPRAVRPPSVAQQSVPAAASPAASPSGQYVGPRTADGRPLSELTPEERDMELRRRREERRKRREAEVEQRTREEQEILQQERSPQQDQ